MRIKAILVPVAVVLGLTSPIWAAHLLWRLNPEMHVNMLVVDYTVPTDTYSNHKGLFWLLNHRRILGPHAGGVWHEEEDYLGFSPYGQGSAIRIHQVSLDQYDWLYLLDAYGVHEADLKNRKGFENFKADKNGFLFGGLSKEDASTLKSFVDGGGNIVFEFNSLTEPIDPEVRRVIESLANVQWLGWTGRFVSQIENYHLESPWFKPLYRANYPRTEMPTGPGLILVDRKGKLVVLSGEPFEKTAPTLVLNDASRAWVGAPVGSPPFYGWFAIIAAGRGSEIMAEIKLPTPKKWIEQLNDARLPLQFPLLVRTDKQGSSRYYISGNISVADKLPNHYGLAGLPRILSTLHRRRDSVDFGPTFWQFFMPVMGALLTKAATTGGD